MAGLQIHLSKLEILVFCFWTLSTPSSLCREGGGGRPRTPSTVIGPSDLHDHDPNTLRRARGLQRPRDEMGGFHGQKASSAAQRTFCEHQTTRQSLPRPLSRFNLLFWQFIAVASSTGLQCALCRAVRKLSVSPPTFFKTATPVIGRRDSKRLREDMALFQTTNACGRMTGHANVNMVRESIIVKLRRAYKSLLLSTFFVSCDSSPLPGQR